MIVKLLTEHHLEFLSLKEGCRGSYEFTLVKMSNCWLISCRPSNHLAKIGEGLEPMSFLLINTCMQQELRDLRRNINMYNHYMCLDATKPVFWVSKKARS